MARIKLTPEIESAVVTYIQQKGTLDGCTIGLPIAARSIWNYIDSGSRSYQPGFHIKVKEAFAFYGKTHRHPSDDPEIKQDVLTQFREMVKAGQSNEQTIEYDDGGKPVRKLYKKPGVEQWVFNTAFPPKMFTERAILSVTSNLLKDITTFPFEKEETRQAVIAWLSDWIRRATEELHKQGLNVKVLEL